MQHYQVVSVPISVKPECIQEFIAVTTENAVQSRKEPGVVRFELLQSRQQPTEFMLLEVFKTPQDQKKHWETEHYKVFKEKIPDLVQRPYTGQLFGFVSAEVE